MCIAKSLDRYHFGEVGDLKSLDTMLLLTVILIF